MVRIRAGPNPIFRRAPTVPVATRGAGGGWCGFIRRVVSTATPHMTQFRGTRCQKLGHAAAPGKRDVGRSGRPSLGERSARGGIGRPSIRDPPASITCRRTAARGCGAAAAPSRPAIFTFSFREARCAGEPAFQELVLSRIIETCLHPHPSKTDPCFIIQGGGRSTVPLFPATTVAFFSSNACGSYQTVKPQKIMLFQNLYRKQKCTSLLYIQFIY